jgi:TP53 regulating kinase-like protein
MAHMIRRGAEADIVLGRWLNRTAIFKIRTRRPYMHYELDLRMRTSRTLHEAELLSASKELGVVTPVVFHVDLRGFTIVMQYLRGPRLKEVLAERAPRVDLCSVMGSYLGRLHKGGIAHGDPTTSNFIFSHGRLALIDFGLSYRTSSLEDLAVDLHLVREVFHSAHPSMSREAMEAFQEGYRKERGLTASQEIWGRVADIERRGRYARSEWSGD